MAVTLQLTDGTTTVNLANSTGPELEANYLPVFATPTGDGTIPPDITEAVPVYLNITSDNNLAATMQDISRLAEQAALYTSNKHQTPVWFHRKLDNETGAIRFLVKSITFTPNAQFGGVFDEGPCIDEGRLGALSITHHPYGERTVAVAASGSDSVSVLGGLIDYPNVAEDNVAGDVDGRLYYLHIDDIAAARVYRQFWIGFRSDLRAGGNAANVASLWEVEDGTPNAANDTGAAGDVLASPGGGGNTIHQCDFAVRPTWYERSTIVMSDVTANYANQVGSFVVLLRAQVDGNSAEVKIRSGNSLAAGVAYNEGPTVTVDATSYTLYNMGVVTWPTRDLHAIPTALFAATYDQRDSIEIWARVTPGGTAPTLDLDCLVLIPADEYWIHVQSAEASGGAGDADHLYVCVSPEDTESAATIDTGSNWIQTSCPVSVIGAGIPNGDGRAFIAIANDNDGTAPAFGDTVDVELSTFPRWIEFRGTE